MPEVISNDEKQTTKPKRQRPTGRFLSQASTKAKPSKNIIFLHGKPGVGKTTFAAHAPRPVFFIDRLEKGILKLMETGQVPKIPVLPPFTNYRDLCDALDELVLETHDFQSLVIDSMTGVENMMFEHIANEEFDGNFNKEGFFAFGKGPDTAMKHYWPDFMSKIETVRESGLDVYLIGHSAVTMFANPLGESYDRWEPSIHKKSWRAIDHAVDNILFMDRHVSMEKVGLKTKAKDTDNRIIRCEWSPAFDAKNRLALPPVVEMGSSGKEAWDNFATCLEKGD